MEGRKKAIIKLKHWSPFFDAEGHRGFISISIATSNVIGFLKLGDILYCEVVSLGLLGYDN